MARATSPVTTAHQQPRGCVVASVADAALPDGDDGAPALFHRFVDLLYRRRQVRAAFDACVARSGFLDHALGRRCSRAMAMARLAARLGSDGPRLQVLHAVCEGDIGMVHLAVHSHSDAPPTRRVEIYRLTDGRITEHWSVAGAPA